MCTYERKNVYCFSDDSHFRAHNNSVSLSLSLSRLRTRSSIIFQRAETFRICIPIWLMSTVRCCISPSCFARYQNESGVECCGCCFAFDKWIHSIQQFFQRAFIIFFSFTKTERLNAVSHVYNFLPVFTRISLSLVCIIFPRHAVPNRIHTQHTHTQLLFTLLLLLTLYLFLPSTRWLLNSTHKPIHSYMHTAQTQAHAHTYICMNENIKFIAWLIISTLNIISVLCAFVSVHRVHMCVYACARAQNTIHT